MQKYPTSSLFVKLQSVYRVDLTIMPVLYVLKKLQKEIKVSVQCNSTLVFPGEFLVQQKILSYCIAKLGEPTH